MKAINRLDNFPSIRTNLKVEMISDNEVKLVSESNDEFNLSLDDFSRKSKLEVSKVYQMRKTIFTSQRKGKPNTKVIKVVFGDGLDGVKPIDGKAPSEYQRISWTNLISKGESFRFLEKRKSSLFIEVNGEHFKIDQLKNYQDFENGLTYSAEMKWFRNAYSELRHRIIVSKVDSNLN